jgi:glucan biosynthesis protein C
LPTALLSKSVPRLREASAATLPFYVLHRPIAVVIAFFVAQLQFGVYLKFFLILGSALAVTVAALCWVVLPATALRFLFGIGAARLP